MSKVSLSAEIDSRFFLTKFKILFNLPEADFKKTIPLIAIANEDKVQASFQ